MRLLAVSARAHPAVHGRAIRRLPDAGTFLATRGFCVCLCQNNRMELQTNGLIYLIGLIVVIMFVISLLGLR